MITIQPTDEFDVKLTGDDLRILLAGLGELPHKVAAPLENKLQQQVELQVKKE